jgi:transposase
MPPFQTEVMLAYRTSFLKMGFTGRVPLRRIATGRNNWTFLGSDNGGHTAAVLLSLVATCERHHVNPFVYLRDVLARIAAHPANSVAELLPHRWQPASIPVSA